MYLHVCSVGEKSKLENEVECEMVVCADDPKLLEKLDQAAEKGKLWHEMLFVIYVYFTYLVYFLSRQFPFQFDIIPAFHVAGLRVLLTHVERASPSLQFLSRLVRPAGCCIPGVKQRFQQTHPEFCLVLSTQLPVKLLSSCKKDFLSLLKTIYLSIIPSNKYK